MFVPGKPFQSNVMLDYYLLGTFISYVVNEVLWPNKLKYLYLASLTTSFYLDLMNGPRTLSCFITISWNGLPVTNTSILVPIVSYEENEVFVHYYCV